jgi:hypothetical protein
VICQKTLKELFKSTRQTNLEYLHKLGLIMILIVKSERLERDICITYTKQGEKIKRNFKRTKKICSQIWLCIFVKSLNCKANLQVDHNDIRNLTHQAVGIGLQMR